MVKDEIVGTYWYVVNNGEKWLTQGGKPIQTAGGFFRRSGEGMGWLCLSTPDVVCKDGVILTNEDYKSLNFPNIPPETPVEIEIVKSGRIYTYEP